jgi:hypothetical protein
LPAANIPRLDAPARGRADLQRIGGSHAQRDVFDRITIEAALRGGYTDAAEALLHDRMVRVAGPPTAMPPPACP